MEKSSIQALGRVLRHEFKPPEDLPFPLRKALEALAKLPPEPAGGAPADRPTQPPTASSSSLMADATKAQLIRLVQNFNRN